MPIKHAFTSPKGDSGDPDVVGPNEWNAAHDIHGALVKPTSGQSVGNNLFTPYVYLTFASLVGTDYGGLWNAGAPDRLTCQRAGRYLCSAGWAHNGTSSTNTQAIIGAQQYSSTDTLLFDRSIRYIAPFSHENMVSLVLDLAVGDYVKVKVYQVTGATRTTAPDLCWLSLTELI